MFLCERLFECIKWCVMGSYNESGSGSMNGVAPNGSMLASNILLMMELPAMEAARPARKPEIHQIRVILLGNVITRQ